MRRFVEACEAVAATTKKLSRSRASANCFSRFRWRTPPPTIFLTGRPFAHRDERVLGIGGSQLVKAVAQIAKTDHAELARVIARTAIWAIWPNIYC